MSGRASVVLACLALAALTFFGILLLPYLLVPYGKGVGGTFPRIVIVAAFAWAIRSLVRFAVRSARAE